MRMLSNVLDADVMRMYISIVFMIVSLFFICITGFFFVPIFLLSLGVDFRTSCEINK